MDTYLSPLHFLPEGTALNDVSTKELLLAKKKLLAEIELSSDKTIILNKTVCTRNDVLNLFDQLLDDEEALNYHFAIFQDKVLLEFLENRFVAILPVSIASNLKNDEGFINFISPYFEKVYTPLLIQCIKRLRLAEINILAANSCLMNYADRDKNYKAIDVLLNKYIEHIAIHTQKIKADRDLAVPKSFIVSEFEHYYDNSLITILNLLPEQFNNVRSEYCRALMYLAIALHFFDTKLRVRIIKNVQNLRCSNSMRQTVQEIHDMLSKNDSPKSGPGRLFLYIIAAIAIMKIIAFIVLIIIAYLF